MSANSDRRTGADLLQIVLDSLPYPFYIIDVADYRVRVANAAARQTYASGEATCHALAHRQGIPCHTEDHPCPLEIIRQTGQPATVQHIHFDDRGNPRYVEVHGFPLFDEAGHLTQIIEYCVDITDGRKAAEDLHRIEWMLTAKPQTEGGLLAPRTVPPYGDLAELNTRRLIRDSVGESILRGIVGDYLSLLDTASLIYEKNGDYAYGVFSSSWCRFLDLTSREHCGTPDNREALGCGQWHCHESCWTRASRCSIESGEPVDVECSGGIRMYAVPIRAGEEVIGSISFGYGDPPRNLQKLKEVADRYGVDVEDLRRHAEQYQSRPPFIIELAKQRLMRSAQLIGEIVQRKQAQAGLAHFKLLSDHSRDIILFIRLDDGRILDANAAAMQAYGYSREELLERTIHDLRADHTPELAIDQMRQADAQGILFETVHQRKDGNTFHVEVSSQGATIGDTRTLISVIRDISERKKAEEALRESEQRFKSTFENAAVGIAHVALDGRFIRFNDRFVEIAGHPADELTGATCPQITQQDDREAEQRQVQRLRDGQIHHYTIEKRYVRKDGDLSWVSLTRSLQRDDAGRPEHYIVIVQDISQRKQLEEELRHMNQSLEEEVKVRTEQLTTTVGQLQDEVARRVAAEGRLRRRSQMLEGFFQHTITPLAFLDRNFTFVWVNEAYAKADGKDPESFIGKNHFDLYPDDENRAIFQQVVRTRQPYRAYAKPFLYPDDSHKGTTYWNWLVTPLLDERGQVEFLVFNLENVTEQQQALQEVEERARQLQQLTLELSQAEDRERKRLAEILHDDLQQMLAAAKFQMGMLANRVRGIADVREIAGQIKELLSQAIDKSRSLSHELSPPVLGQSDLCETFAWLAEHVQAKHGLDVEVEACDKVEVHSEPLKAFLFKAAQEMLFNVIKHAKVKEARLRLQCRRGYISLSVADKGQGFDPQSLGQGGFGLRSIRERVKLLGGRMRVLSRPGRGSVFLIKVPAPQMAPVETQWTGEPSAAKMAAQKKRQERSAEPGLRVLLVDDHKIVREGLEAMLIEEQDIKVVGQAGNGREAVELAHQLQPDVIVMDVSMPVMAGDAATRLIKLHLPQTRIIALSMFDDARTADRMRKAGAAAYLLKTAPSEELLAAIRGSESLSLVDNRL